MDLVVSRDSLSLYLKEIERFPVLRREEEYALAVRYREYNDLEAARTLVTSNLRFVVKVAREYTGIGLKLHDLIQEGNIGLMMAVKRFDPYRGIRLLSYAIHWIRAYIHSFIMKSWSLVKIGTTGAQRVLFSKLRGLRPSSLDSREIAETLNIKESEVISMGERLANRDLSLDAPLGEDSGQSKVDLIEDANPNQEEVLISIGESEDVRNRVHQALKGLSEKEAYIVENRLMADEPLTLQEIGERFGISRERARQIEAGAIKKLTGLLAPVVKEDM
jgi:RNA polymerase sigma-32 factor